jgi:hypothetical protein
MPTLFVAGSRRISRLPAEVKRRLDTMIDKHFQILAGDANGADKAVQRYLADKSYPNVLVHCMKDHCRNNVGNWPKREVAAPRGAKGFDYYSLNDRAMAEAAEYGLMLWGDKRKGTVNAPSRPFVRRRRKKDRDDFWRPARCREGARCSWDVPPSRWSASCPRVLPSRSHICGPRFHYGRPAMPPLEGAAVRVFGGERAFTG